MLKFKHWETLIQTMIDQAVRNQMFLNQLSKILEGSSAFRMVVDRSIQKALETLTLPSIRDLESLGDRLEELTEFAKGNRKKLESIDAQLAHLTKLVEALGAPGARGGRKGKVSAP